VDINWSTFLLETVNFLILVWLLKHFLFKPVQEVIAQRKAVVDKTLADAAKILAEGEKLKAGYESRLADWEREKQAARETLDQQLQDEYQQKLEAMQTTLAEERAKARAAEERHQEESKRRLEVGAMQQGARFATILLTKAAGRETEGRLIESFLGELRKLPEERLAALRLSCGDNPKTIMVTSAFAIPDEMRKKLEAALADLCGLEVPVRFACDGELLAGLQIAINHLVLGLNLRDELRDFALLSTAEG
jgi:F-type H+-transporting ATPase subunit b